ncbi:hypothetical protein HPP92_028274 [Vanilla planifolia]|uniref:Uncharacterized protein n=1 Tax=Vanilla planifolia TaxID=51239 RepID=A0A835P9Q2_VANPL|nr:hypothetical protein HPP92_028274 [Vanilla planifolia]
MNSQAQQWISGSEKKKKKKKGEREGGDFIDYDYSLCEGLRQNPAPENWGHISFSISDTSATGDFSGQGSGFSAGNVDATWVLDAEGFDSVSTDPGGFLFFRFEADRRFFLLLTARRKSPAGSFTIVSTRRLMRPQGQQHTTAAHSAAVPPATSATRFFGFFGTSFRISRCFLVIGVNPPGVATSSVDSPPLDAAPFVISMRISAITTSPERGGNFRAHSKLHRDAEEKQIRRLLKKRPPRLTWQAMEPSTSTESCTAGEWIEHFLKLFGV